MGKMLGKVGNDPIRAAVMINLPFLRSVILQRKLKLFKGSSNMAAWQVVLCFYAVIVALNLIASFY